MKVKATKKLIKEGLRPRELDHKPIENEEFEVTEERYNLLLEKGYVEAIIKAVANKIADEDIKGNATEEPNGIFETAVVEVEKETAVKKTTKKKNAKR